MQYIIIYVHASGRGYRYYYRSPGHYAHYFNICAAAAAIRRLVFAHVVGTYGRINAGHRDKWIFIEFQLVNLCAFN